MIPGVSTACLYPLETEKSLATLAGAGIRTAEVFLNAPCEMHMGFVKELRLMADAYGVHIPAVHPFSSNEETPMFFTDYPRRFEDGLEQYGRYCEVVRQLGGDILVFHGMHKSLTMNMEEYAQRFARIAQMADRHGVRLCHENVERSASRSPDFFRKLRRYFPEAKFVLDIKQALRASCDPFEMLEAMGEQVAHIHVSDNSPENDCLPIGEGTFEFKRFKEKLMELNYEGCLMLELYGKGHSGVSQLAQSYRRLGTLCSQKSLDVNNCHEVKRFTAN